jgi:hypothetical protein
VRSQSFDGTAAIVIVSSEFGSMRRGPGEVRGRIRPRTARFGQNPLFICVGIRRLEVIGTTDRSWLADSTRLIRYPHKGTPSRPAGSD